MSRRRSRSYEDEYELEEAVELGDVLEPYENAEWTEAEPSPQEAYADADYDAYPEDYVAYMDDDFAQEEAEVDHETRFRIAIGAFDFVSIFVGIVVILMLLTMLLTLFSWLRSDILHSAVLLQSGLQ